MAATNANDGVIITGEVSTSRWDAPRWDLTRDSNDDRDGDDAESSSSSHEQLLSNRAMASSPDEEGGHACNDNPTKEPVSLAVAADVTQVHIPDDAPEHAMGGAVAQHLQNMLSHISSNANDHVASIWGGPSLKSELDRPTNNNSAATEVTSNGDEAQHQQQAGADENNVGMGQSQQSSSQPPPPQKEFIFKRIFHAIDNYLHPPSKLLSHVHFPSPRHHHQGHRLNSISAHSVSNHACNMTCLPNCDLQQRQDRQTSFASSRHSSRRIPEFAASVSTRAASFASNISTHLHHRNSDAQMEPKQTKSFFPLSLNSRSQSEPAKQRGNARRFTGPLLYNTSDHDEHDAVITTALHVCELYWRGQDVLKYTHHESEYYSSDSDGRRSSLTDSEHHEVEEGGGGKERSYYFDHRARHALSSLGFEFRLNVCQNCSGENGPNQNNNNCEDHVEGEPHTCHNCVTRLYHVPSDQAVDKDNRRNFIADGKMYDAVANLCQAAAQEIMAEACDLTWVTICDGRGGGRIRSPSLGQEPRRRLRSASVEEWPRDEKGDIVVREPVRALVGRQKKNGSSNHPHDTFLVATGKGKVRAGVFSRHHLLTTGLEPSTALPLLREARDRGMNCVVIDPNARGDRIGMETFEISIRGLFEQESNLTEESEDGDSASEREMSAIIPADDDGSIYVLAHSAAGGQLVRYLLDQEENAPLLSRIRCITFTDSTHSIQWLKKHPHISSLIQSSKVLYVRSANPMRDDDWENASPGDECPQDHFWSHRFGAIKTVWAGTTEHSLSNWTAQKPIWDHFDKIRGSEGGMAQDSTDGNSSNPRNGSNGTLVDRKEPVAREVAETKGNSTQQMGTKPVVV